MAKIERSLDNDQVFFILSLPLSLSLSLSLRFIYSIFVPLSKRNLKTDEKFLYLP